MESLGRSPNTRRAITHHLKLFWEFLRDERAEWTEVDIARLASFISWLRRPASALPSIAPQESERTNATIDQMLSSFHGFYAFKIRLGHFLDNTLFLFLELRLLLLKPNYYA